MFVTSVSTQGKSIPVATPVAALLDEGMRYLNEIGTLPPDAQKEFLSMLRALRITFLREYSGDKPSA